MQDPHQDPLGLIVSLVPEGDAPGAPLLRDLMEEAQPGNAASFLEGPLLHPGKPADVRLGAEAWQPEETGDPFHESSVFPRSGTPQLVVQMSHRQPEAEARGLARQQVEQRGRVRPPRDRCQHRVSPHDHRVSADHVEEEPVEGHRCRSIRPRAAGEGGW